VSAILAGALVFWLQHEIILHWTWLANVCEQYDDYANLPWILGALLGAGAIGGDAVKSFFKRRVGVPAGHSWMPFDQLDYIVGAIVVSLPFTILPITVYIWMLVFWFGVHVGSTYLGWLLHLKEQPI
jgi:CDP-2,3-bis-(O-geranylgeranyl)-sn-glycerol synthase